MRSLCAGAFVLCCVACGGAQSKWSPLMGQINFAVGRVFFQEDGQIFAQAKGGGQVLKRRTAWNAWEPLPSQVPTVEGVLIPRVFDAAGTIYSSGDVIYQMPKGATNFTLVQKSVGKNLITVDPSGNMFATSRTAPLNVVKLRGSDEWVASEAVTQVDPTGRAYAGNSWLDGLTKVTDESLGIGKKFLFDAKGRVIEFSTEGENARITRREFGKTPVTELAKYKTVQGLELLGCGINGPCVLVKGNTEIFEATGGTIRQIGSTVTTSTFDELNFSGYTFYVGPEGRLYLTDVSGQTINFSRMFRLTPGTDRWPGEQP
jgi:hypothetical protein